MSTNRILLVEDDSIIAYSITRMLENMGPYEVRSLSYGEDVLETVRQMEPNLIIMDILLKGKMDGIEASSQVLQERQVPIIFLTGNSDSLTVGRAREVNPAAYLKKPITRGQFEKTIRDVLPEQ